MLSGKSLRLLDRLYLLARGLRIPLVEQVGKGSELVAVLALCIDVIHHGDESDALLDPLDLVIQLGVDMLSAETGKILYDHGLDKPLVDIRAHALEIRSVVVRARPAVVNVELRVREFVLLCVFEQIFFLIGNAVAFALVLVVLRQTAVKGGNDFLLS